MANLEKQPKFSVSISSPAMQSLITKTITDKATRDKLVSSLITMVSLNKLLQSCDTASLLSCGFQANALNIPLSQTLGYCYAIPYRNSERGYTAQFQLGWKGFVQLAIRTNYYKTLGVLEVRKGQLKGFNSWGEPLVDLSEEKLNEPIIGYFAYYRLINGGEKCLYWSKEKCEIHAKKYSKSYGSGKSTDNWTNSFDEMALKTVIKQLLSKWGPLSPELEKAIQVDQAVMDENGGLTYIDRAQETPKENETPSPTTTIKNELHIQEQEQGEYDLTEENGEII